MGITLEQARALRAVADCGSLVKAAEKLRKRHSAIVYVMKNLEQETGLEILDRSRYRTTLTPVGKRVLEECDRILKAEKDLVLLCKDLTSGWEPFFSLVYDGFVPFEPLLRTIERMFARKIPTRIQVYSEFHRGVEEAFLERDANAMISVIPPQRKGLETVRLSPMRSLLVAHRDHPLAKGRGRNKRPLETLTQYPIVTVKGSDPRLNLPTATLEKDSSFHVNDFYSKKQAIAMGVGYGWMPEYLVYKELKSGKLSMVRWAGENVHTFFPHLYHKGERHMGRAGRFFLEEFLKLQCVPDCGDCARFRRCGSG